jgi:hypothetical protein
MSTILISSFATYRTYGAFALGGREHAKIWKGFYWRARRNVGSAHAAWRWLHRHHRFSRRSDRWRELVEQFVVQLGHRRNGWRRDFFELEQQQWQSERLCIEYRLFDAQSDLRRTQRHLRRMPPGRGLFDEAWDGVFGRRLRLSYAG